MRRVFVVVIASAWIGGFGAPPASAQADATAVARGLIAAENAHDVSAAVAFFAPGAIVNLPTGVFIGHAQITQWQRELAAGNFHAEITPPVAVTHEIVTFSGTVALNSFRALGISPLDATWELTVQLGQITTFNFAFTPAATARLQAALAGAGAGGGGAGATASAGSGGATGGSSAGWPSTAAAASAPRSLALTGSGAGLLGPVAVALVLLGTVLLAAGGRTRRRTS
jgi:hypothetical protein